MAVIAACAEDPTRCIRESQYSNVGARSLYHLDLCDDHLALSIPLSMSSCMWETCWLVVMQVKYRKREATRKHSTALARAILGWVISVSSERS